MTRVYTEKSAVHDREGVYRYQLIRKWEGGPMLTYVLLNPSTANDEADDPTVRKLVGFTERFGYAGFRLVNLFAYRATDPTHLRLAFNRGEDIVGPENNFWLEHAASWGDQIVLAWGSHAHFFSRRVEEALAILRRSERELKCITTTKDGHPAHPVRLPYRLAPQPYLGRT